MLLCVCNGAYRANTSDCVQTEALICCFAYAGDKFALLDDDEEQLTHMGKSLAADDFQLVSFISPYPPASLLARLLPPSVHESVPPLTSCGAHILSSKFWPAGRTKRLGSP